MECWMITDSMRIKDGDNTVNLAPPKETVAPGDATGSAACVLLTAQQHPIIHASICVAGEFMSQEILNKHTWRMLFNV